MGGDGAAKDLFCSRLARGRHAVPGLSSCSVNICLKPACRPSPAQPKLLLSPLVWSSVLGVQFWQVVGFSLPGSLSSLCGSRPWLTPGTRSEGGGGRAAAAGSWSRAGVHLLVEVNLVRSPLRSGRGSRSTAPGVCPPAAAQIRWSSHHPPPPFPPPFHRAVKACAQRPRSQGLPEAMGILKTGAGESRDAPTSPGASPHWKEKVGTA